ncbi:MAG: hypothetical protein OEV00_01665 [Acidobacteriota bacterium]|nr:hypothetical protein [Acidobacteriota bacterium]MDH3784015.1 hypothetical protein [Acidobacteriota bacterium]
MRRIIALPIAAILIFGTLTPGFSQRRGRIDVHPKLDTTSFIEDGRRLSLIVGTRAAIQRLDRDFIPLEIAVVNRGFAGLTLTPESFALVDADGRRYPAVSGGTLKKAYGNIDVDRRLSVLSSILRARHAFYTPVDGPLTASFDRPFVRDIKLHRFSFATEIVYFPRPTGDVAGQQLRLIMKTRELDEPVVVSFLIASRKS